MNKISRVSRSLSIFFKILFVALPIYTVAVWLFLSGTVLLSHHGEHFQFAQFFPMGDLPILLRLFGVFINALTTVPVMMILFFLIKLFSNYQQQRIFTYDNAKFYRFIGITIIVWQGLTIVQQVLLALLLTWFDITKHVAITISFYSSNATIVIVGVMIILVSWVMMEAHQLEQETTYTV